MANKELEAELWCPSCRHVYAVLYRVQVREGIWENQTEPKAFTNYCGICEIGLERKPA